MPLAKEKRRMVIWGLMLILLLVFILPFDFKWVEENLELFLFIMGLAASIISGTLNAELIYIAFKEPWMIATAVFVAGALFYILKNKFADFMVLVFEKIPLGVVVFYTILLLGLLSSIITAIIASIILVEIINLLPLRRQHIIVICVLACFSIGLGAALTPLGEPLATIAISRLGEDFFYLLDLLGKYVIPAIVCLSLLGGIYTSVAMKKLEGKKGKNLVTVKALKRFKTTEEENWQTIIIRTIKIYLYVMALIFLGKGFEPLINRYILGLSPNLLYFVNMVSAVLDNATLTAAEISPQMSSLTVEAILMGLLISGGMLIPGNIPNIFSSTKLKISSKEWARIGTPLGLILMIIFYFIIF